MTVTWSIVHIGCSPVHSKDCFFFFFHCAWHESGTSHHRNRWANSGLVLECYKNTGVRSLLALYLGSFAVVCCSFLPAVYVSSPRLFLYHRWNARHSLSVQCILRHVSAYLLRQMSEPTVCIAKFQEKKSFFSYRTWMWQSCRECPWPFCNCSSIRVSLYCF